jgi:hypothetical protein
LDHLNIRALTALTLLTLDVSWTPASEEDIQERLRALPAAVEVVLQRHGVMMQ